MRPLLLWLAFLVGFCVMAAFAASYETFAADLWLAHRLQEIDVSAVVRMMDLAADLADWPFVVLVWLGAAAALLPLAGSRQSAILLVSMAARLANSGVKELIERPRPSSDLVRVSDPGSGFSFPSGHAEGSLVLYGLLFYFAAVYLGNAWARLAVQAACLWAIIFTGMQRVYVGAHWPSDVAGGFYFGALVAAALIALDRLALFRPAGATYPRLRRGL